MRFFFFFVWNFGLVLWGLGLEVILFVFFYGVILIIERISYILGFVLVSWIRGNEECRLVEKVGFLLRCFLVISEYIFGFR